MDNGFDSPKPTPRITLSSELQNITSTTDPSITLSSQDLLGPKELGDERKRFWNMLALLIPMTGYQSPEHRTVQVLDIACGKCREGFVLSTYFGGNRFGNPSPNVLVSGIDINPDDINTANENNSSYDIDRKTRVPMFNYQFINGDATNLDQYPQLPQTADVFVIRHQQISSNEVTWTTIFQQAIDRLGENGIGIITSFSDVEHDMLIGKLEQLHCEVVMNKPNPHAEPTETQGVSVDRHIAIVKKGSLASGILI